MDGRGGVLLSFAGYGGVVTTFTTAGLKGVAK
jgi:hypothetical protein